MTYLELIKTLKSISLSQPNVHSFVRQFDDLNREDTVYSAIILQDQQHVQAGDFINYSFYISYTDRLVENNSNEDSIISTAISIINNIANTFREIYPYEVNLSNYNIFQQRFTSLCAGAYSTITISIPAALCAEDISGLDALSTTITSNGDYNFIPDGLGFDSVHIVVDVPPFPKPEEEFDVQPTTTDQRITPTKGHASGGGTVRAVTSEIDNNIKPENIRNGISILGVEGTIEVEPDYRYAKGTIDKEGLKAIGWTDEDIITYKQNAPHYPWQNDQYKVSEENKALYLQDNPDPSSYKNNPNITFIPKKNMESYFAKASGFFGMYYIKGIPFYDTSKVTSMYYMFNGCSSLITIPLLDTSNVTNMEQTFYSCSSLTTIPQLDTSKVTNMTSMFSWCQNLITIPRLDTSNVTNMTSMFSGCPNLKTIPPLDTSNVTGMSWVFQGCTYLKTIPPLDTSNATNMDYMFSGCTNLKTIPPLNTSNVTDMGSMFSSCSQLTTVEGIDFSSLKSNDPKLFGWSSNMPNLIRFIVNGKINVRITNNDGIKALSKIDYDSVKSILAAADRTDNTIKKTLAFNRTMTDQNGELAALVASCSTKGWTITGLTLQ